jgi:hypothetical protein
LKDFRLPVAVAVPHVWKSLMSFAAIAGLESNRPDRVNILSILNFDSTGLSSP